MRYAYMKNAIKGALVILQVVLLSSLSSCKVGNSIEQASDAVREASKNIRSGLQEGAEAIDPVAIKKLLEENENLRQALLDLQVKTTSFGPSVGLIKLSNARLLLRVSDYRGQFVVDAWIDDKNQWILRQRAYNDSSSARIALNTPLGVNLGAAFDDYCRATHTSCDPIRSAENVYGAQHYFYDNAVVPRFSSLVAASIDAENRRALDLQHQLPSGGRHWISVQVTPTARNPSSNDWFIRWQLVQVFADGSEQVLKEADWSSALPALASHTMGTPLEPFVVAVDATL